MEEIERLLQLHEVLEIHYRVDHYSAELYVDDGDRLTIYGSGKTIQEAIEKLNEEAKKYTLLEIRHFEFWKD